MMKALYIIPARGGSKGIPRKNIKLLAGIPLIAYSIKLAKEIADVDDICISTDDVEISKVSEDWGVPVRFLRPENLATDRAASYDVFIHAIDYYLKLGKHYDALVILQPTSPLRTVQQVKDAINQYEDSLDMVVSVKETASNPYYVLFEENTEGFLVKSKPGNFIRRQDCPPVYEYNGAIYIINIESLRRSHISQFTKVRKFLMSDINSVDIDTPLDWSFTEFLLQNELVKL
jgi:CMP-N,N'-diacetyllegionaminic acid synthase